MRGSVWADLCGFTSSVRKVFSPPKDVIHRATCPVCGRDLVNLYRYDKEYLCRTCRIAAIEIDKVIKHEE